MVCQLRYFCILVYLMHDVSIQLVAKSWHFVVPYCQEN